MSGIETLKTLDFNTGRPVEVSDQVALSVKDKPLHKGGAICLAAVGLFLGANVSFGVPAPRLGEAVMLKESGNGRLDIPRQRDPHSTQNFSATHR